MGFDNELESEEDNEEVEEYYEEDDEDDEGSEGKEEEKEGKFKHLPFDRIKRYKAIEKSKEIRRENNFQLGKTKRTILSHRLC